MLMPLRPPFVEINGWARLIQPQNAIVGGWPLSRENDSLGGHVRQRLLRHHVLAALPTLAREVAHEERQSLLAHLEAGKMDNYHDQILNRGPPQSKGQGAELEESPILSEQY